MKIFLDFGHGGSETGAVSNGLVEKNMNLTTGLACREVLQQYGIDVRSSRTDDRYVGLNERANMANSWGADYFVSIHYNSGGGDGIEVIHSIYRGKGETLAKAIVNAVNRDTGQNLRPTPTYSRTGSDGKDYYAVIRETSMDAIIVESGFIDSGDRVLFDTPEKQKSMGRAIAHGILDHLGISYEEENNNTVEPQYYVETSYINPDVYVNGILGFFDDNGIKIQIKSDAKGPFIQTMHMDLDRCRLIAYTFTSRFDIMAYVWREDKITDQNGNISYTPRTLV
ncbi:N-acetylmuramoyl-L-alanine amidase [Clostridium punense]|uniref:N-acetylmuramoyl-L-alanine amidase n=1 Tax=Clostridium punense TaxID=1054297 RepID=A0ABS4K886_9CLOT|nr:MULTISPECIES: N-acetylmuramoyl-L-alanine amidase [Clostridium]EQB89611.1 N-acetylmuramoyl-L-alanine amidase [Clostridium sp. BL8]MBP2023997.1 N-acetylmuramoyl-L-alanine amidase [Clostridium punense]